MPFELMREKCDQCLMTPRKIVSDRRRAQLLADVREADTHFLCHKGTMAGRYIACRGHYDSTGGGRVGRFAKWIGVIREIDPKTLLSVEKAGG